MGPTFSIKKTPNVVKHTIHFAHLAYSLLTPKKKAIPQKPSWFQNDEKNLQKSHGTGIFTYIYHKNKPNVVNIPYTFCAFGLYTPPPKQKLTIPEKSVVIFKNDEKIKNNKTPIPSDPEDPWDWYFYLYTFTLKK